MKFKNLIMLLSCFLIFTSNVECGLNFKFNLGKSGVQYDPKSGKFNLRPAGLGYTQLRGHTHRRGAEACSKLKEVCDDLRYVKGCEYKEWVKFPNTAVAKTNCLCKNVELKGLPF